MASASQGSGLPRPNYPDYLASLQNVVGKSGAEREAAILAVIDVFIAAAQNQYMISKICKRFPPPFDFLPYRTNSCWGNCNRYLICDACFDIASIDTSSFQEAEISSIPPLKLDHQEVERLVIQDIQKIESAQYQVKRVDRTHPQKLKNGDWIVINFDNCSM